MLFISTVSWEVYLVIRGVLSSINQTDSLLYIKTDSIGNYHFAISISMGATNNLKEVFRFYILSKMKTSLRIIQIMVFVWSWEEKYSIRSRPSSSFYNSALQQGL